MVNTYRHDHRPSKLKVSLFAVSFLVGLGGILLAGLFIYSDIQNNQSDVVEGEGRTVAQVLGDADALFVNEDNFSFELPDDWREIDRVDTAREQSITWQATLRGEDNRYLKLYMNTIPDDPLVRLLPIKVDGQRIQRGQMSPNCSSFTGSGATNRSERRGEPATPTRWEDIDFVCNVGSIVDENVVGTGQEGQPLNTFTITGEESGTNQYFFVYTDRNVRPNFEIFYGAVNTFYAK